MRTDDWFLDRVNVNHKTGCWLWNRYINPKTMYAQSGSKMVHRLTYEHFVGPIPEGKWLDHRKTCAKHCVNPKHLTPVSPAVNTQLGWRRRRGQMSRKDLRVSRWVHKQVSERMQRAGL